MATRRVEQEKRPRLFRHVRFAGQKRTCAVQGAMSLRPLAATSRLYSNLRAILWHQHCQNDRYEEKCRCICNQMAAFGRIIESLNAHDGTVNHARLHGEPNKALVRVGVLRCDE